MGLGKLGSWAANGSGDLFLAFSTPIPESRATIAATEEAVVNAMLAAPVTFTGADGLRISGLPGDRLVAAMKKYGRMK